jgi:hypothetical protein
MGVMCVYNQAVLFESYHCMLCFTIIIWHIEQVELGRKYDDLELLKNDTHPQFNLIKARN